VAETPGGIPNRAWFKASEVCELAGIQPYVLRSWESEFPSLGVSRGEGKPRVYRREDVELVLRIKRLVVGEGFTLSGVRRSLECELAPAPETVRLSEVLGPEVVQRVSEVRQGLRSLLDMLAPAGEKAEHAHAEGQAPASTPAAGASEQQPDASALADAEAARSAEPESATAALPFGGGVGEEPSGTGSESGSTGGPEDTRRRPRKRSARRSGTPPVAT